MEPSWRDRLRILRALWSVDGDPLPMFSTDAMRLSRAELRWAERLNVIYRAIGENDEKEYYGVRGPLHALWLLLIVRPLGSDEDEEE